MKTRRDDHRELVDFQKAKKEGRRAFQSNDRRILKKECRRVWGMDFRSSSKALRFQVWLIREKGKIC